MFVDERNGQEEACCILYGLRYCSWLLAERKQAVVPLRCFLIVDLYFHKYEFTILQSVTQIFEHSKLRRKFLEVFLCRTLNVKVSEQCSTAHCHNFLVSRAWNSSMCVILQAYPEVSHVVLRMVFQAYSESFRKITKNSLVLKKKSFTHPE